MAVHAAVPPSSSVPPARSSAGHRLSSLANVVVVATGLLLTLTATFAFAVEPELAVVDPRSMLVAPRIDDVPAGRLAVAGLAAAGMAASAGLPGRRAGAWPGAGQAAAGALALCGTAAAVALTSIWYFGPENPCRYPSCWPAEAQAAAVAAPGLLAAVILVVAAVLAGKLSWTARALFPPAVWLAAVAILHSAWEPWLLPILLGPPP